jgi:hypothetical protein
MLGMPHQTVAEAPDRAERSLGPIPKGLRRAQNAVGGNSGASEALGPYPFSASSLRSSLSLSQSSYFWPLGMVASSRE